MWFSFYCNLEAHTVSCRSLLSLINREEIDRISTTRPYSSAMAATSLVSPNSMSMFQNCPPPPYSGWSGLPAHPVSGLISPPDLRRTSDNKTIAPPPIQTVPPHRQSLPSIHEALNSAGSKSRPYVSPVSASLPASHHQLPYTQSQAPTIPRTYSSEHASYQTQLAPSQPRRLSPPHPLHSHLHSLVGTESMASTFPESRHASLMTLHGAPGPPPNASAASGYENSKYEQESRAPERANGYPHLTPPSLPPSYQQGLTSSHLPPSGTSASPHNQPRYRQRDGTESTDSWKLREGYKTEPPEFSHGLKRHLDVWDFENNLAQVSCPACVVEHFLNLDRSIRPAESLWNGLTTIMQLLKNSNEDCTRSRTGCPRWTIARK